MAKKQTRRSVSIAKLLHERLVAEAAADRVSLSEWITRLARNELERRGRPFGVQLSHQPVDAVARMREKRSVA